ncbi:MAG TPA: hypothetical protein VNO82_11480 [Solirubrobacteraceae bacterium]|nr:hypothetical protein [Solirubrobacteraceae bacterium]
MLLLDVSSIWQPDAKGSKRRGWLIILSATVVSAVLALVAFTDVL